MNAGASRFSLPHASSSRAGCVEHLVEHAHWTFGMLAAAALLLGGSGCGTFSATSMRSAQPGSIAAIDPAYLPSGSIILSQRAPRRDTAVAMATLAKGKKAAPALAPLIGYFPPSASYLPAENETWLEINRSAKKLRLYKGKSVIKEIAGEGDVSLSEGDYYLQHKQKQPLWYAPDEYFKRRRLALPAPSDRLRYRRGALGRYALYPTNTFAIHSGPIWSKDVGGLRISDADLSSIFYMLPVGAPIVVKD